MTHALASIHSHVLQVFQVISHILGFRSVLRVINLIVVAVPFLQFLTCTRIPCGDSHFENGSVEVLSLQDRRQLKTIHLQQKRNKNS